MKQVFKGHSSVLLLCRLPIFYFSKSGTLSYNFAKKLDIFLLGEFYEHIISRFTNLGQVCVIKYFEKIKVNIYQFQYVQ